MRQRSATMGLVVGAVGALCLWDVRHLGYDSVASLALFVLTLLAVAGIMSRRNPDYDEKAETPHDPDRFVLYFLAFFEPPRAECSSFRIIDRRTPLTLVRSLGRWRRFIELHVTRCTC